MTLRRRNHPEGCSQMADGLSDWIHPAVEKKELKQWYKGFVR